MADRILEKMAQEEIQRRMSEQASTAGQPNPTVDDSKYMT